MRFTRLGSMAAIVFTLSLLAACGGGGGGGGGSVPNPGGGNGGGATPTPTAMPTSTSGPTSTPTISPTPSPTPTATPTATSSPSGGPTSSQVTVSVGDGEVNGTDGQIVSSEPNQHGNSGEGNLEPGDPGALPQGGGQGPVGGGAVDGIPCNASMSNNYHVHAFVGIMYNGQEIALPDGTGMVDPYGEFTDPSTGVPNQEIYADCFYFTHTHDASGMLHIEAPSPTCGAASNYTTPCNMSLYTLGNYFDVWGISISAGNFGPFNGPVSVYTSPLQYGACTVSGPCYSPSRTYSLYTGDPRTIPLYSHTVVWIVIGTQPTSATSLPNIQWINGNP